jgi:hypothetical protein
MTLKILSVGIVLLLFYGYSQRRQSRIHIPVMVGAFILDMLLVLYIELNRHAMEQAVGPTTLLMKVHLFFSFGVLILYLVQIVGGVLRHREAGASWHKEAGMAFLLFRVGNLVTSFFIPASG